MMLLLLYVVFVIVIIVIVIHDTRERNLKPSSDSKMVDSLDWLPFVTNNFQTVPIENL
jgi:formate-dependent nitrite reductase membrane component NrfD